MKGVTFIRSISDLHAEHSVACTPRKVIRNMTSGFDVGEVELDMQMRFLNAAPFGRLLRFLLAAKEFGV